MLEAALNQKPWKAPTQDKDKRDRSAVRYAKILAHLAKGPSNRELIAQATKINMTTLHKDLVNLEYAGKVDGERNGTHITWSIASE